MSNVDEYSKEGIVEMLIRRDKMKRPDAVELVEAVQEEVNACCDSPDSELEDVENIIEDMLGLEPDFVMTFLPF